MRYKHSMRVWRLFRAACLTVAVSSLASAFGLEPLEEFRVKRELVFEFAEPPGLARDGDRFTISFTSKAYCDATVAIENDKGRIVRHLASGVLGKNAPRPFVRNSLKQRIVWDGKDDQGEYLDDLDGITARVSLGLKPQFERTLFSSQYKRYGGLPLLAAAPEGVYVFDGVGVDFVRLYDHEGRYVRTIYPFPREKLSEFKDLNWKDMPQGYRLPRKGGLYQVSLLTSGANWHTGNHGVARHANGASAMAVSPVGNYLALAQVELNRLGTDGGPAMLGRKPLPLRGPRTGLEVTSVAGGLEVMVGPGSMDFSPDGKSLYMTGYLWRTGSWRKVPGCEHAVYKLDYAGSGERTVFLGHPTQDGTDNSHLRVPTAVVCDAEGRVYVSDFLNDRVIVLDANGRHLRNIPVQKPAQLCLNRKNGELWVISFPVIGVPDSMEKIFAEQLKKVTHTVTRFSAFPESKRVSHEPITLGMSDSGGFEATGHLYNIALDSWAPEPTLWIAGRKHAARAEEFQFSGHYDKNDLDPRVLKAGVRLQRKHGDAWEVVRSFGDVAEEAMVQARTPRHNIQRLIVNPVTGKLYVAEPDSGPTIKASNSWVEVDPETGAIKIIPLPFNAMEGAFDLEGNVYLRNMDMIARYDFRTWREIPWDYGEERDRLGNDGSIHGKATKVVSGLKMPSTSPVCYHQGGIYVSPKGDVVASCAYRYVGISSGRLSGKNLEQHEVYKPRMFPGRVVNSTSPCIHVWDKHGQLKYEDALPGMGQCDGVGMDAYDDLYIMHTPSRFIDGKPYFNEMSETLMKVTPNNSRVLSSSGSPIPLGDESRPNRPPDLHSTRHGNAWVENAEWFYGGVGFAGFNMRGHGGGCACWFARFSLDYFGRSIAPEPHQYSVAVLDSAGNLILRIGQYGNVEDGVPLVPDPEVRHARSVGNDEVSLMHACFVGTHTDRRVFIADLGNARILSVKLDYHASRRLPLK